MEDYFNKVFKYIDSSSEVRSYWVAYKNGRYPKDAVQGDDDERSRLLVARALHEGSLIPGQLVPASKLCYIVGDSKDCEKSEYEVLCGLRTTWGTVNEGEALPYNALPAGHTADLETLYVGRVFHMGKQHLGKVQPSKGACYIFYDGEEKIFRTFEILLIP